MDSITTTTTTATSGANCNQSYMVYLGQQLQELYESKLFCDLTLKSASPNGTEDALRCHRVVLAAASTHLKDRLSDDVSELDLTPMTSSTLELVICYIYTGSCSIEERNVCELLEASKSWNLPHLSEGCFAYMERTISTKNACPFYEYASYYQNTTIMNAVSHFIRQNFEQLHTSGQIKALSLSSFCSIISSDRINIVSEDSIFASAITLIQKPESTAEEVTRCFQLIRYEYFTGEFFFDAVMFHPLMQESPQKEFLKNAVAYHCSKDNPSIALQPRMERRSWTHYRDERLVYIGYDRRMYAMDDQGSAQVMSGGGIPEWMDEFSSASSFKSQLVVVGGGDIENVNNVAMVDCTSMTLSMLPALPLTLSRAGVLYTGQHIHVVGGGHSGSRIPVNYVLPVGRYDWETCEQVARPVSRPLVAQRGSLIYVIGGYVGEVLAGIAVYNIRTATWRQVKEMPHGCTRYNAGRKTTVRYNAGP